MSKCWMFKFIRVLILVGLFFSINVYPLLAEPVAQENYHRIVIVGDPHFSTETGAVKLGVIDEINSWQDVDLVVVLGDIVKELGTADEYEQAKTFVSQLNKPAAIIAGNHEYMYDDSKTAGGKLRWGDPGLRKIKLERFKEAYGLQEVFYSNRLAHYLLVFLSPDVTDGKYLTEISEKEIEWLRLTLSENVEVPTLIFFHAPLEGTLETYNSKINSSQRIAMPVETIHDILQHNPQVLSWISGHTHTPATNPSFNSDVNIYEGRVLNIHNSSMGGKTIWTNSIYLYDDEIAIRTFNHNEGEWVESLDRVISLDGQRK